MNWNASNLLFVVLWGLWSCRTLGISGVMSQPFYLYLTKHQEENISLTLRDCDNTTCLRRGEKDLKCMCEKRYRKAEGMRQQCGDNGRNEISVQALEIMNRPDVLGVCARAFAGLGYVVNIENDTSNVKHFYMADNFSETMSQLTSYSMGFWQLLDRTLVGVYLSSNQQRNTCKDAYNEWLCSTLLSLYSADGNGTLTEIKPCLGLCTRVVQKCPYYLPSQLQERAKTEIIYGGYPVFDCPDWEILVQYQRRCKECSIPYEINKDNPCIGQQDTALSLHVCTLLLVLLSIISLSWKI